MNTEHCTSITPCQPQLLFHFPHNSTESIVYQFTSCDAFMKYIENPLEPNPFALFDFWILHINHMATVWICIFIFPGGDPHG